MNATRPGHGGFLRSLALAVSLAACTTNEPRPLTVASADTPSPNASILPAPLVSTRRIDPASDGLAAAPSASSPLDAAIPPRWLREDTPLELDPLTPRETRAAFALQARFTWPGLTPTPSPQADPRAVARLLEATERRVEITLAPVGRLRLVLATTSFVSERGVELRARSDHLGHLVVWPDRRSYRALQPGSLRAFLREGRADVLALEPAAPDAPQPATGLGRDATTIRLTNDHGVLTLTQAKIPETGSGGSILCRALLELLSTHPSAAVCAPGLIPVRADYAWADGGRLGFEVTELAPAPDTEPESLRVPPSSPHFKADLLPLGPSVPLLTDPELRSLRRHDAPPETLPPGAPEQGLRLANHGDLPSYALLDGVPVARVVPNRSVTLQTLRPGSYQLRWVDFFATAPSPAAPVTVPGEATLGGPPPDPESPVSP